jgi:hypothetical protein
VTATQAIASKTLTRNHMTPSFTPVTGAGGTGALRIAFRPGSKLRMSSATGAIAGAPTATSLTNYFSFS